MDLNRRAYLDAIGISCWQLREVPAAAAADSAAPPTAGADIPLEGPSLAADAHAATPPPVATQTLEDERPPLDWEALEQAVAGCGQCPELAASRVRTVFGSGRHPAELLIVGDAPDADDERADALFSGEVGRLLDLMLAAIGFDRTRNAYLANVLKCRPPGDRAPTPQEATACAAFLQRQIELLRPRLILVLGPAAARALLTSEQPIEQLRGRAHYYGECNIPLVVTGHPADLLRSPAHKRLAWDDLRYARRLLREAAP